MMSGFGGSRGSDGMGLVVVFWGAVLGIWAIGDLE